MDSTQKHPTHFYDVRARLVACRQATPDDHSSKHVRSVTCPACLEHLAAEPGAEAAEPPAAVH